MLKIAIILGSTRPGRNGEAVARWVHEKASKRKDATYELVDLAEQNLPLLDEAKPASMGQYEHAHTKAWASKIAGYDGFVFVTAEYNHAIPGALKNAIDFLFAEWNDKAAGFVSYGSAGGTRAVEQLRQVMAELKIADVRAQLTFALATDFEKMKTFKPATPEQNKKTLNEMLDQVVAWSTALRAVRKGETQKANAAE